MLKAGIVGLPNVGKSTLFNAVTRTRKAEAANYPFCTIDPNIGIVTVPDDRMYVLQGIAKTTVVIPAAIEFVDIAGLERMPESKRRRSLERALKFLREDYAGKILDFTEGVAIEWGRLVATAKKRGRNLSVLDSQIEATAIHFGLLVVTRNGKDFFHPVFNPWK